MTSKIVHRGGGKLFGFTIDNYLGTLYPENLEGLDFYSAKFDGRWGVESGDAIILIHKDIKYHNSTSMTGSSVTKESDGYYVVINIKNSGQDLGPNLTYVFFDDSIESCINYYNGPIYNIHDIVKIDKIPFTSLTFIQVQI